MKYHYNENSEHIVSEICDFCQNDRADIEIEMQDYMDENYNSNYIVREAYYCDDNCWTAKVDYRQ